MKALLLLAAPPGSLPGQRYRVEQWLSLLPADGLDATLLPCSARRPTPGLHVPGDRARKAWGTTAALERRVAQVARARRAEVVYLYREAFPLGPAFLEPPRTKRHRHPCRQRPLRMRGRSVQPHTD